ncbi:MAG: undecaprenyldiphospho-muramoylpentapeptide beta-N-acetylglucosaminyltransferase [Ferruginibacter sp.]|nr:undecaprenyldiphospho-muramoylpentapeptide beta-N-acetylglucosaminyltransferase [Ferruginibacter sp.]
MEHQLAKAKKFIIAGGGTGGHIFPAIAIANALKKKSPDAVFLFIGAKGKMEMEKVPQAGYDIKGITIAGYNRSSLIKNIGLPVKLVKSFIQVSRIVNEFAPDAVIGVGGYSSFPVLRYAQSKGIPTFIHESNSFAGKSNMWLAKKAKKIFTVSEGMEKFFPLSKIVVTGNPVRKAIVNNNIGRETALDFFGLNRSRITVLCIGGSLGAKSINEAIDEGLDLILDKNLQVIWQTGKLYLDKARLRSKDKKGVYVTDFITDMNYGYAAADIVISRSGAMSIAELCIASKPVIFVPYPFAAENHQTVNALNLVDKNAGIMIEDKDTKVQLVDGLISLAADEIKLKELAHNINKLGVINADEIIANEILNEI